MTSRFEEDGENLTLPQHWEMRVDSRTGMPYYLNHLKQFTTWDDPRVVEEPRGMLNNMGSMVREPRRSISPPPSAFLRRTTEDGSTTIPFSHQFFATPEPGFSQYTQSLPRPRRNNRPIAPRRQQPEGTWLHTKLDSSDDDFFNGSQWPPRFQTLRARSQSPFGCIPRRGSPVQRDLGQPSVSIPISTEHDSDETGVEESVIVPSQYKQAVDKGSTEEKHKNSESPLPKQAKQGETNVMRSEAKQGETNAMRSEAKQGENNATRSEAKQKVSLDHETESDNGSEARLMPESTLPTDINDNQTVSPEMTDEQPKADQAENGLKNSEQTKDTVDSATENASSFTDDNQACASENIEKTDELQEKTDISYKAIDKVREEITGYEQEVKEFSGDKGCKQFRYLEEMLTRCQLKLDDIETHGDLELRKRRKETVNKIDSLLHDLESRCKPLT